MRCASSHTRGRWSISQGFRAEPSAAISDARGIAASSPIQVKLFTDRDAKEVEDVVNDWLRKNEHRVRVTATQTAFTNVAEKADDGTYPAILIAIWYEHL